ncbi:MAG: RsmE family RNA methyltransferase [Balneolaceae bacterium]
MNNIFFAPISGFTKENTVEIIGQEALHISKVLRHNIGDSILVADGEGARFEAEITELSKKSVEAKILTTNCEARPEKEKVMALGIIKKRDRLEFAIEKTVELGASELCLFNADHSERTKLNKDRVQLHIVSAFKQSGRYWLPKLVVLNSLDEVLSHYSDSEFCMAHEEIEVSNQPKALTAEQTILLVGPEGGFSSREVALNKEKGGSFVSLGKNRLRAETAVTAFLSQYLFSM